MSLRPKPYHQTLKDLTDASSKINDYAVSTDEILTFDENTDVLLPSGKFAKSLDKRLKEQFSQSVVLSVNDKTGHIELGNVVDYDVSDLPISDAQKEYIVNSRKNVIYVDDEIKESDLNDHSIAFRRAITKAGIGGTVLFTGGKTYNMHSPSIVRTGQRITSIGGVATLVNMFDQTTYPRGTNLALIQAGYSLTGAYTDTVTLGTTSVVLAHGNSTMTVDNPANFKIGMLINVLNHTARVINVVGSVIHLDRIALYDIAAGSKVYGINAIRHIEVSNFHIDFNGTTANPRYGYGINIHAAADCHVHNITAENVGSKVVQFARASNCTAKDITCVIGTDNRGNGGHGYVLRFGLGADSCVADNVVGTSTRHTIDLAGASRNLITRCISYMNDSTAFLTHGLNTHGNTFLDCSVFGAMDGAYHFPVGDRYNTVDGGYLTGKMFVGNAEFDETTTIRNVTIENSSLNSNIGTIAFQNCKFIFGQGLPSSMLRYAGVAEATWNFLGCHFVFRNGAPASSLVSASGTDKLVLNMTNCQLDYHSIIPCSTLNKESVWNIRGCVVTAPNSTLTATLIQSSGTINVANTHLSFPTSGVYFFGLEAPTTVLHLRNVVVENSTAIWRRFGQLPLVILDDVQLVNSNYPSFSNTKLKTNTGYCDLSYPPPAAAYSVGDVLNTSLMTVGSYRHYVYDGAAWKGFGKIE